MFHALKRYIICLCFNLEHQVILLKTFSEYLLRTRYIVAYLIWYFYSDSFVTVPFSFISRSQPYHFRSQPFLSLFISVMFPFRFRSISVTFSFYFRYISVSFPLHFRFIFVTFVAHCGTCTGHLTPQIMKQCGAMLR